MKKLTIMMVFLFSVSLVVLSGSVEPKVETKKDATEESKPFEAAVSASDDTIKVETVHYIGPDEYVVIQNTGNQLVSLEGWTLISTIGGEEYVFGNVSVKAHDTISLHSGPEATGLVWTEEYVFYDPSDGVMLYNDQGKYISFFRWGR